MTNLKSPALTGRNTGIDLLRIASMYMVVLLHVVGAGGVLSATRPFSAGNFAAWTLEIGAYCASNCYALISGYVGIHSKYRYSNIVVLWLQVALYSVVGTLIFFLVDPAQVGMKQLVYAFFPVTKGSLWYFSAYFGLFFFIPLINRAVLALNRRQAKLLCLTFFVLLSVIPSLMFTDAFFSNGGYSVFWLMVMYFIGACIRKFDLLAKIRSLPLVLCYGLCVALTIGCWAFLKADIIPILSKVLPANFLISYISPTVLICGICLLLIFSRLKLRSVAAAKVIGFLSPLSFGVYAIHCQPQIFDFLFQDDPFARFAQYPPWLLVLAALFSAAALFIICAALDLLRHLLFKVLKLKQRLLKWENNRLRDFWTITPPKT